MTKERRSILVVDDEDEILTVIGEAIHDLGSMGVMDNVFLAKDGEEASRICKRIKIDALVTDLKMPNKTGEELIEEVRKEQGSDIPVFVLSAYATTEISDALKALENVKVFKKPVDITQLLKDLSEYLDKIKS